MLKMYLYVLKLENGCYYVGKSSNVNSRLNSHYSGNGSYWTKIHPPIEGNPLELIEYTPYSELAKTLEYMDRYGIDSVRGSIYCRKNLSDEQRREIESHLRAEKNLCYQCGGRHFVSDCRGNNNVSLCRKIIEWFGLCCRDRVVGFGKHKGETYNHVYDNDPNYCRWVLSKGGGNSEEMREFYEWLLYMEND